MQQDKSFHGGVLLVVYAFIALTPLVLGLIEGFPPPLSSFEKVLGYPQRSWLDNVGSGLALVAYPMLLMEFATNGRIQFITGRISYQRVLSFHHVSAIMLGVFALAHPYFYYVPESLIPIYRPQDVPHLGLTAASTLTGMLAWLLLVVLIVMAIARDQITYRYETWRITHVVLSVLVVGLVLHHALVAGRYSQTTGLTLYWIVLVGLAGLSLIYVFLILPLRMLRRPFRLAGKSAQGDGGWLLTFEPEGFTPRAFQKGQVVWITFKSPFSLLEHPFTIASDAGQTPGISFFVVEKGDWTNHIGDIPLGARAYLNGPYG